LGGGWWLYLEVAEKERTALWEATALAMGTRAAARWTVRRPVARAKREAEESMMAV